MTYTAQIAPRSVTTDLAARFGMEPGPFEATLRATVVPKDCSREQFAAFLLVAREYDLNPITKEIYAFPAKGGGIQPIVSIDGWLKIINSREEFDGMEFVDNVDDAGELLSVTCRIYRRDRNRPTELTEYMSECRRDTDTWRKWPARMLRHKATIQCARYAFGFSGIYDPDEAERFHEVDVTPRKPETRRPQARVIEQHVEPTQADQINAALNSNGLSAADLCEALGVMSIPAIPAERFVEALEWVGEQAE